MPKDTRKNQAEAKPRNGNVQEYKLTAKSTVHLFVNPCAGWTNDTVLEALQDGSAEWDSELRNIFTDEQNENGENDKQVIAKVERLEIVTSQDDWQLIEIPLLGD